VYNPFDQPFDSTQCRLRFLRQAQNKTLRSGWSGI